MPSGLTALLVSTTPLWIVVARARSSVNGPGHCPWWARWSGFAGTAVLARPGALGRGRVAGRRPHPRGDGVLGHRLALLAPARLARPISFVASRLPDAVRGCRPCVVGRAGARRGAATSTSGPCRPRGGGRWRTWSSSGAWSPTRRTSGCSRMRRCSSSTTYAYVNPVVAVALGWLLLGEPVTGAGPRRAARSR